MEKRLEKRKGYLNRHLDGMPTEKVNMKIVTYDFEGEHIDECEWSPFNEDDYAENYEKPAKGYLGTARIIKGHYKGIGFHAWEQNNSEFVYYDLI